MESLSRAVRIDAQLSLLLQHGMITVIFLGELYHAGLTLDDIFKEENDLRVVKDSYYQYI